MIFIFTNETTGGWYEGAWQSLYEDNYDRVYKTALKIVIDKGLAEDVAQDNRVVSFETMDTKVPDNLIQLGEMDNPEILYEENEAAREILNYIEGLDSEGRHILHLKFYEELTYAEIAEQMKMKKGTIRMKALRARKIILDKMNRHVDKEGLGS